MSLKQEWGNFAREVGITDLPERIQRNLKRSFYAGSLVTIHLISKASVSEGVEALEKLMEDLSDELMVWGQEELAQKLRREGD